MTASTPPADDVRDAVRVVNANATLAALAHMEEVAADRHQMQPVKLSILRRRIVALQRQIENQAIEVRPHGTVTPPAYDVREALAAARNVEQYLDMLALDGDDPVHVVIDDGYDGDGAIQSLEIPDLRTLIAFVREVRPNGTVTDAEVDAAGRHLGMDDGMEHWIDRDSVRAALEAAREVHP